MYLNDKAIDRFWAKVEFAEQDECWVWQSATTAGKYGLFWLNGRSVLATHVAFFLANGFIDLSLDVLHSCDYPICVNARHLKQGTAAENSQEAVQRNRMPKGSQKTQAKLNEEKVLEMRLKFQQRSITYKSLAAEYGVSSKTAQQAIKGDTWQHI